MYVSEPYVNVVLDRLNCGGNTKGGKIDEMAALVPLPQFSSVWVCMAS